MPRLLVICWLIGLSSGYALAQPKKIDSLFALLARHPQADTFRVNRLIDLAGVFFDKYPPDNPPRLDSIGKVIMQLSRQLKYHYGQASAFGTFAGLAYAKGDMKQYMALGEQGLAEAKRSGNKMIISQFLMGLGAIRVGQQKETYFQQALAVVESTAKKDSIFDTHITIVNIYASTDYAAALRWAFPLLAQVEKDTNTIHHYLTLVKIAEIYTSLKDVDQALVYLKRSQLVANKRRDKAQLGASLTRIGELYQQKRQPEKAIKAFQQALPFVRNLREDWVIRIEAHLAGCYVQKGQYSQTLRYARGALAKMRTTKDVFFYFERFRYTAWLALSEAHLHTGRLDSALYYGNKCFAYVQLGDLRAGYLERPRDVAKVLAQIYAAKKEYARAYQFQSQYITYKDSLNNEDVTRKATAARFSQQMSRQQSQIALLRKDGQLKAQEARRQRQFLYSSLVVLALIGSLLALLYRNNRHKQQANLVLQGQKAKIEAQRDKIIAQRDQLNQTLTELKETQAQLIQKEKMASLGELTKGIVDRLLNPLNYINNFALTAQEFLQEIRLLTQKHQASLSPDEQDELDDSAQLLGQNLTKIHEHGHSSARILQDMQKLLRERSSTLVPTELNEYLPPSIDTARQKAQALYPNLPLTLDLELCPQPTPVMIVPVEFDDVLVRLVDNACYTLAEKRRRVPDFEPHLRVGTQVVDEQVVLTLWDNGRGIAAREVVQLFNPFFTTKPTAKGTGLSLYMGKEMIRRWQGQLLIESVEEQYTQVSIWLPLREPKEPYPPGESYANQLG